MQTHIYRITEIQNTEISVQSKTKLRIQIYSYEYLLALLNMWVFPGGKVRPGRAADHSPPSSAAVMEE